jgi:hypothetical protein
MTTDSWFGVKQVTCPVTPQDDADSPARVNYGQQAIWTCQSGYWTNAANGNAIEGSLTSETCNVDNRGEANPISFPGVLCEQVCKIIIIIINVIHLTYCFCLNKRENIYTERERIEKKGKKERDRECFLLFFN